MLQQANLVIRHGARLDAADAQWHLTSPTPYDPPLTYGGWRQSQALGARIASIIQSREAAADTQSADGPRRGSEMNGDGEAMEGRNLHPSHRGKRRKHKVVIHSSPFLRCIQTSVAISAGMSQYRGSTQANNHPSPAKHTMHSGKPHMRSVDHGRSARLAAIIEPEVNGTPGSGGRRKVKVAQTLLRVDAFLGEWLSPDYFDKITPPPESKLMVAGAKADLLRRGDPIDIVHSSSRMASNQGLWGGTASANIEAETIDHGKPLDDLSSLSQGLPRLARANSSSYGSSEVKRSSLRVSSRVEKGLTPKSLSYVPPTPSYAVSPSQPIPQGYVAHARDGCVKVDYQWDSLRPPLEWGNGGDYGEEWSSMHMRFRKGLQGMLSWYGGHEPTELVRTLSAGLPDPSEGSDDSETDTVLVLVTHGAGCNALIGALTNQPVLLDVGMASLTLAVRKSIDYTRVAPPSNSRSSTSPSRRRRSAMGTGIANDYEVKLTASTDHLRAGSPFLAGSYLQRTATQPVREKSPYRYERSVFVSPHSSKPNGINEENNSNSESDSATPTSEDTFGGKARSATTTTTIRPSSGIGLWSKPVLPKVDQVIEKATEHASPPADHPVRFPIPDTDHAHETKNGDHLDSNGLETLSRDGNLGRSIAPSGLWGAPPFAMGTERDMGLVPFLLTRSSWKLSIIA